MRSTRQGAVGGLHRSLLLAAAVFAAGASAATPAPVSKVTPGYAGQRGDGDGERAARIADPQLLRQLRDGGRRDFFVELEDQADLSSAYGMPWIERGRYVYRTLRDTAERSQAGVRRELAAKGAQIRPHWIVNGFVVKDGDLATLSRAAGFSEVKRVAMLPRVAGAEARASQAAGARAANGITPNLQWIGVDRVWDQGTTGAGVTIGFIGAGVVHVHEALHPQYRGWRADGNDQHDYAWFDPEGHSPQPRLNEGELTAPNVGIAVGDNRSTDPAKRERIGVAPGARWMACAGIGTDAGDPAYLIDCLEYMLAPTRTDGTMPDPDRRPEIVNNIWVMNGTCDGQAQPEFASFVDAWVAAGIVPVFPGGDAANCALPEPPGLSSINAPASLAASFAVGTTGNHDGQYAKTSLWGPTAAVSTGLPALPDPRGFPQLKPQVVAPGMNVRTALSDTSGYQFVSGSSISAPHASGVFALMIEAGECLRGDYAKLGTLMMQTATPRPYDTGGTPAPGIGNVPNYATGWGEINAAAAVEAAAAACGPSGFVRGRIIDTTGAPVGNAKIEITSNASPRTYSLATEADGRYAYRLPQLLAGGYAVRAAAYGYAPALESGVLVDAGDTVVRDIVLSKATMHHVSGRVTDAATGWPLHAHIAIAGYPGQAVWTDPQTGLYAVSLPAGTQYRFDATSDVTGYKPASRDVPDPAASVQNFALQADLVTCAAPGYAYARTLLPVEGFETNGTAPPAGWTRASNGLGWLFGTRKTLASESFPLIAHGRFAASNDQLGTGENDAGADTLTLPALNLVGAVDPALRFTYLRPFSSFGRATVEGSRDGGSTWISLGAISPVETWTEASVSLAPLAGSTTARVRFHNDDQGSIGMPFAIDDVSVRGECRAPTQGGLVIGHVRDANTGIALDGAVVSTGSGSAVSGKSDDPLVDSGYYTVHAAAGGATLDVARGSLHGGYGSGTASVAVVAGGIVRTDVALPAGRLQLYPQNGPGANATLGTVTTVPLRVSNNGTAPLAFGFEAAEVIEDFESTSFPPAGWTVVDSGASACRWVSTGSQESIGSGMGAMVYGWLCYDGDPTVDSTLVSPPVDLSSGTATLHFRFVLPVGYMTSPRFDVDISTDGGATWTNAWSRSAFGSVEQVALDLTPFVAAAATNARVRFHYTQTPFFGGGVVIDDIRLFNGASTPASFDLAPESGTLAPGQTRDLQATFDARSYHQPGTYAEMLRVIDDTPYAKTFDGSIKATITVTAPASYGRFGGTVRGLGACDAHPVALPGAGVVVRNVRGETFETTTDADGRYVYWLPAGDGPFSLIATAEGHRDADARTSTLTAGAESRVDLDLRALLPCLMSDPAQLVANVAPGQSATKPLQLLNGGTVQAIWSARAGGDPAELVPLPVTQTRSPDVNPDAFVACRYETGVTMENYYLRAFPLADHPNPSEILSVSGIEFAINRAQANSGTQTVYARLYKVRGAMRFANMQLLREKAVGIEDTQASRVRVRFDTPALVGRDATLVAAIYVPDGRTAGNVFVPGYNLAGETAPTYIASNDCETPEPTTPGDASPDLAGLNLLLDLDVDGSDPCNAQATPVPWLSFSPAGGTLAVDAAVPVQATVTAGTLAIGTHRGTMCMSTTADGKPTAVPVTLGVGNSDTIFKNGFEQ